MTNEIHTNFKDENNIFAEKLFNYLFYFLLLFLFYFFRFFRFYFLFLSLSDLS